MRKQLTQLRTEVDRLMHICKGVGVDFAANYLGDVSGIGVDQLVAFLHDPKAEVRQAAFALLEDRQVYSNEILKIAEEILLSDTDQLVRVSAFQYLGKRFDGTGSDYYSRLYAKIVSDDTQSAPVRLAAYQSLIYLRGLSVDWMPAVWELQFPDDVDWSFVKQCSTGY
ncbi:MAG TPA: HEAT repeat domain-containing protein [Gemmataceae bacterium]